MAAGQFVGAFHRFLLPVGPVDERIVDGNAVRVHYVADHHQPVLAIEIDALNAIQLRIRPVQTTGLIVDRQSCGFEVERFEEVQSQVCDDRSQLAYRSAIRCLP